MRLRATESVEVAQQSFDQLSRATAAQPVGSLTVRFRLKYIYTLSTGGNSAVSRLSSCQNLLHFIWQPIGRDHVLQTTVGQWVIGRMWRRLMWRCSCLIEIDEVAALLLFIYYFVGFTLSAMTYSRSYSWWWRRETSTSVWITCFCHQRF